MLKFYKSRSKFTVKVTCLKSMALPYWKGQDIRNTYAKYESPISYSEKAMADVQKYVKGLGQGHMFKIDGTIGKALS